MTAGLALSLALPAFVDPAYTSDKVVNFLLQSKSHKLGATRGVDPPAQAHQRPGVAGFGGGAIAFDGLIELTGGEKRARQQRLIMSRAGACGATASLSTATAARTVGAARAAGGGVDDGRQIAQGGARGRRGVTLAMASA